MNNTYVSLFTYCDTVNTSLVMRLNVSIICMVLNNAKWSCILIKLLKKTTGTIYVSF